MSTRKEFDDWLEEADRLVDLAIQYKREYLSGLEYAASQSGQWFPRLKAKWTHQANFKEVIYQEVMERLHNHKPPTA